MILSYEGLKDAEAWKNAGIVDLNTFCGISTSAPSALYRSAYEQTAWYQATN
jgi:hypothetical protein